MGYKIQKKIQKLKVWKDQYEFVGYEDECRDYVRRVCENPMFNIYTMLRKNGWKWEKVLVDDVPINEKDVAYEEIRWHIKQYGNTISVKEPSEILDKLKEEGIICQATRSQFGKYWILNEQR